MIVIFVQDMVKEFKDIIVGSEKSKSPHKTAPDHTFPKLYLEPNVISSTFI